MIYHLVNKTTEVLLLAISLIAHLCNQFNLVFALIISMPRSKRNNFVKTGLTLSFFFKKRSKFLSAGGSAHTAYFWLRA